MILRPCDWLEVVPSESFREKLSNSNNKPFKNENNYTYGHDFSDGVAWVWVFVEEDIGSYDKGLWHLIDKTGRIILELAEGENPASNFSHGVALVRRSDQTVELIDKDGNIISSPKSGEYDEIRAFILDLGMILVYKRVETFELTEDRGGIINNQGNWQIDLCNEKIFACWRMNEQILGSNDPKMRPLLHIEPQSCSQDICYKDSGIPKYTPPNSTPPHYYIGEGLFVGLKIKDQTTEVYDATYFYNIENGETMTIDLRQYIDDYSENKNTILQFEPFNNEMGFFFVNRRTIFSINKSGQINEVMKTNLYSSYVGNYNDGLFFHITREEDRSAMNYLAVDAGFYDITGNKIIDLSSYDFPSTFYVGNYYGYPVEFSNGYCLLQILNPQGSPYYTVIDKNGNMMFEPLHLDGRLSSLSNDIFMIRKEGSTSIINIYGEVVAEIAGRNIIKSSNDVDYSISDYKDDVALVRVFKKDNTTYPTAQALYYIDKTGKRLF